MPPLIFAYALLAQFRGAPTPTAEELGDGGLFPTPDPISTPGAGADPFAGNFYSIPAGPAGARGGYPYEEAAGLPNPLGISSLSQLIQKIVEALTLIAAPIVTLMVMYGAWKIVTSAGDAAKLKEGGKIIMYAAVGFGIMLLSGGLTQIIQSLFS